jgi:hypothetical protein
MGDEKLTAVCVRPRVCHREYSGLVVFQVGRKFVFEFITGTSCAVARGTAPLDHEVRNDPVEGETVIKTLFGQIDKIEDC